MHRIFSHFIRGSLDPGFFDPRLPQRAPRSCPGYSKIASRRDVKEFIHAVTGRTFPPEIIDDCLLDRIAEYIATYGVQEGAKNFRAAIGLTGRAIIRAVSRNVKKHGVLP